jgi:perosamine synthetase
MVQRDVCKETNYSNYIESRFDECMNEIRGAQPRFENIDRILEDIKGVLNSGGLTQGPHLERFEQNFAKLVGVKHAAGVSTGGAGLECILRAIGIEGKEVIVPTDTFVASAFAVLRSGGVPVLADVDRSTLCLSVSTVENLITEKTAAVMIVHMFGLMSPEITSLRKLCEDKGIALIEDAAHAHGASFRGEAAGSLGDAAAFSMYATKIITTGEGGVVTTNNNGIFERVCSLRNYGKRLGGNDFDNVSSNERLAEIPSIIGVHQLKTLEQNIARRNVIANRYLSQLKDVDGVEMLIPDDQSLSSYWRFPLYLNEAIDRDAVQKSMADDFGVRLTWMYEPLCHLQPALQDRFEHRVGDMPVAEKAMGQLICLPTHMAMENSDIERVVEALTKSISLCLV